MVWSQIYNPLGNAWLSTLVAAIPIVVLLCALGIFRIKAHVAAIYGLIASLLVATIVYGMPVSMAGETAVYGAAFGLMPIGWIILNVIFLYQLTLERGYFKVMQDSIAGVSQDRRLSTAAEERVSTVSLVSAARSYGSRGDQANPCWGSEN